MAGQQAYIVFRRTSEDGEDALLGSTRKVAILLGKDIFQGELSLTEEDITLRDVVKIMGYLKHMRQSIPFDCNLDELSPTSSVSRILSELDHAKSFMENEIINSQDKLEKLTDHFLGGFIKDDKDEQSYFELQTAGSAYLNGIELICSKSYVGEIMLNVVYLEGTYYCVMEEVGGAEQPLIDSRFPDIGKRGAGFLLKSYENHPIFRKLSIWHVIPKALSDAKREISKSGVASIEEKEEAEAKIVEDLSWSAWCDDFSDGDDYEPLDESVLPGRKNESFMGGYSQIYCVLKPEGETTTRRALFRYGEWCYAGNIELEKRVQLADVPHVLRCFQKQQGNLAYFCTIRNMPVNLPFSAPIRRMSEATAFLEKAIGQSEETLLDLMKNTDDHTWNARLGWIDEESGCQFFELVTPGDQPHYSDVELLACKTYYNEVVLITLYFEGSFYVTISPCIDDQPLLDMSFPDVSTKAQGLQLATYRHREFKRFMLWRSERSVWEAANRAVMEDRRRKAQEKMEAEMRREAQMVNSLESKFGDKDDIAREDTAGEKAAAKKEPVRAEAKQVRASRSVSSDASQVRREGDDIRGRGRTRESKGQPRSVAKSNAKERLRPQEKSQPKASANPLSRRANEMKNQGSAVRAPHHLKPLGGGLSKIAELNKGLQSTQAPWDSEGRPRHLFGNSKPLGPIGGGKK